jgi:ribulose-phosphate 3-epimerase
MLLTQHLPFGCKIEMTPAHLAAHITRTAANCVTLVAVARGKMVPRATLFMALIVPSLLTADFSRLGEALLIFNEAGASMVHIDVMDGHFVPEISVGQPVLQSIRKATDMVLDVHLLIERPERYVSEFVDLGAERVAIHAEATPNAHKVLRTIRAEGAKAGLALNPFTAVESVSDALGEFDHLVILSADLGFASSPFLRKTFPKVQSACTLRRERRLDFEIEVEGGIDEGQVEALCSAGADILVPGSDIFQKDPKTRLANLMRLASSRQMT